MNQYVLILSLGPVQGFIAAARRSRDLWSGSWLLSEISKASARCLHHAGAELIFPAPQDAAQLEPDSDFSVGNKIQALVRAADDAALRSLARQAADAARLRFRELAEEARARLTDDALRLDIWQQQIDDYVESYAAWVRVADGGYRAATETANRLLAARKATRDFAPAALRADDHGRQLPKSSLDGARETVLQEGRIAHRVRLKLGLSESEQLDCAGITKRLAGRIDQFTPLTRLAAHPWLQRLDDAQLDALRQAYEPLVALDLATRVRGNAGRYQAFPFDAQYCYRFRLEAELGVQRHKDAEAHAALQALQNCLKPIWRMAGEPCPYGAILLADGDKMGALLDEAASQAEHIAITRALSGFAGGVPARVREFDGHAIYAGGDDVLAFLPLERAHACAAALATDFADRLQPLARQLNASSLPTLSAGIAIGHILEPLGNLRALAGLAEKTAKGDDCGEQKRNALGITLGIRSGATISLRLRWDDQAAHAAFEGWITAYREKSIPSRIAYDTRAVHLRTAFALAGDDAQPGIQRAEFARMLDRARTRSGERLADASVAALERRAEQLPHLGRLADELIVARWLAARTKADLGDDQ